MLNAQHSTALLPPIGTHVQSTQFMPRDTTPASTPTVVRGLHVDAAILFVEICMQRNLVLWLICLANVCGLLEIWRLVRLHFRDEVTRLAGFIAV